MWNQMAKFQITRGIYISHDLEKERKIIMTCSAVDRGYICLSKVIFKNSLLQFKGILGAEGNFP